MIQQTQVVIIGAGPAGSLAASLLKQQNINCIVLERQLFPRFSIGESLLPACMESLKKAKMFQAVNAARFQFKDGAAFRRTDGYSTFDFTDKHSEGEGTTYQVSRGQFDKILADEAVKQGVDIRYQHSVSDVTIAPTGVQVIVLDANGQPYQIDADFILDASGYGRVLPRLLDLERISNFPRRKALFTHVVDNIAINPQADLNYDRNKITIYVHPTNHNVWYWLIPFSHGVCSLGIVAEPEFFESYPQDELVAIKQLVAEEPHLARLFSCADYPNPTGVIDGYSADVTQLAGERFALLGNAGEFLDPVFSSGVTIAMKSSELAVETLARHYQGEAVDWQQDYVEPLMVGINTFRAYVEGWYDGRLQKVIFYDKPNPTIKSRISSILAGYAWDKSNPLVANPQERLTTLAELCSD